MRHRKKFNHLSRTASHRAAMLSNMACSLIKHKRITTTLAKAKALKMYVEPIITKSKTDSTHSRRLVFASLKDKEVVAELFRDVAQKVADRPGGYTRILKTGFRLGDAAEMCIVELVDYNENMLKDKVAKKKSTRRAGGAKKAADAPVVVTEAPVAEEVAPAVETPEAKAETASVEEVKEELVEVPVEEVKEEKSAPKAKKAPAKEEAPSKDEKPAEDKDEEKASE